MKRYKILSAALLLSLSMTACASTEVKNITSEIDNIGEITLDSEEQLSKIYAEYNALDEADKEKVENYEKLESAMDEYYKLATDDFIIRLDNYTYETVNDLSAEIDTFWDYLDNDQKENALIALGRCQMKDAFEEKIKNHLKSPDSFNLYEYEDTGVNDMGEDCFSLVTIKYGATNSFGAEITSTLMASINFEVDIKNKTVTFTNISCPELDF